MESRWNTLKKSIHLFYAVHIPTSYSVSENRQQCIIIAIDSLTIY